MSGRKRGREGVIGGAGYSRKKFKMNDSISAATKADVALALARRALSGRKPELKVIDVATSTTASSTGFTTELVPCTTGTEISDKLANQVTIRRLQMKMSLVKNASSQFTRVRILIVRGKQENGTLKTLADILQTVDTYSPKNFDDRFDSIILFDQVYHMSSNFSGGSVFGEPPIEIDMKLNFVKSFVSNSADTDNGGLYLMAVSNEATNVPTVQYYSRVSYYDA